MPHPPPSNDASSRPPRPLRALVCDLLVTIALCYLITLSLLVCAKRLHLAFYFLPAPAPESCTSPPGTPWALAPALDLSAYQRALAAITPVDVLRVTTAFSVLAFALTELGYLALLLQEGVRCDKPFSALVFGLNIGHLYQYLGSGNHVLDFKGQGECDVMTLQAAFV
ncbi:hypothetical protein GGX14DRAFT_647646 [Mycena pura]|uniref:Uncharacterized protein n=1 Tax=Mycena pura TaxID=153505 RepID=A0AAD6YDL6_9AGAR|nr:hypothetical protein GGX14DRAFT_647646 [Mycena pura]